MRSKILSKKAIAIFTVTVIVLFSAAVFFVTFAVTSQNKTAVKSVPSQQAFLSEKKISPGSPVRLVISKIHVDAPVDKMGLTSQGFMEAPAGPKNVGWFSLGVRPGEIGSAVIAGHYGRWKTGSGSVFDHLNTLKKGDMISVSDDTGATIVFTVRELRQYDKNGSSEDVFSSTDGKAHLNLVTCEGTWDPVLKTYSNRLVVFSDAVTL
jgi:LPXTG-site transpeptidase (sortase) family protein